MRKLPRQRGTAIASPASHIKEVAHAVADTGMHSGYHIDPVFYLYGRRTDMGTYRYSRRTWDRYIMGLRNILGDSSKVSR